MGKVIYLSPSNHGVNGSRCLKAGCYEDKHTRPIAESAAKYLKASGFTVYIAAPNTTMAARCAESNKVGASLHIPIHTNASGTASARYLMFMCIKTSGEYKKLFDAVAPFMESIYPEHKGAYFVVRKDLYEINAPKAKTFYCELGFHTNKTDCDRFIHNPEPIGKALAQGICKYYGVDFNDGKEKVLEEDGLWGRDTTKYTQKFFGTPQDSIVSNQLNNCKKYLPNMLATSWEFENTTKGGSVMVKKLQSLIGANPDGYAGNDTIMKLQAFLKKQGLYSGKIDGIAGNLTVKGWQKYLNKKLV